MQVTDLKIEEDQIKLTGIMNVPLFKGEKGDKGEPGKNGGVQEDKLFKAYIGTNITAETIARNRKIT